MNDITRPQMQISTSIPTMIGSLQTEWDGVMLEQRKLKETLSVTREELSQVLYQQEAACRVIARLIKERDEAKEELKKVRKTVHEPPGINEALKAKFDKVSDTLSAARGKRRPPADLESEETLSEFKQNPPTKIHTDEITSLKLSQGKLALTGGKDYVAHLYDLEAKNVVATFEHKKKVTAVDFLKNSFNSITCSSDGIAQTWKVSPDYSTELVYTATNHKGSITACSAHPCDSYCVLFSRDGTWSLHDLVRPELVQAVNVQDLTPITSGEVHPDGLMIGTGLKDGKVIIWDIRSQRCSSELEPCKSPIKRLCFSEKGYHMLTLGKEGHKVHLWDLRKLNKEEPILVKTINSIKGITFDPYGVNLAACGKRVEVFSVKKASYMTELGRGDFTDIKFGPKDSYIIVGNYTGQLITIN